MNKFIIIQKCIDEQVEVSGRIHAICNSMYRSICDKNGWCENNIFDLISALPFLNGKFEMIRDLINDPTR
jgi:hypothetical protein